MLILPHLKGLPAGNAGSNTFKSSALDLNFAVRKSLVDSVSGNNLVTFTRASSATYTDSAGVLRSSVTNLLTNSESLTLGFSQQNTTVTSDATTAPDGTTTADLSVPNATSGSHASFRTSLTFAVSTSYAISVFVKPSGYTNFQLAFTSGFNNTNAWANFVLVGGGSLGFTGTSGTATIQALNNGWYRCSLVATSGASATTGGPALLVLDSDRNSRDPSFAGNNTSGIFIWGAQLEQSSTVGEYIPTTSTINSAPRFDHNPTTGESLGLLVEEARTNLLLRSEDFGTTWTLSGLLAFGSGSTLNATTAPDGASTADLITEDTATSTHVITQGSLSFTSGTTYTVSCFVKRGTGSRNAAIALRAAAFSGAPRVNIDLSTGTTTLTGSGGTITSQAYLNGWWRVTLTATATATVTSFVDVGFVSGTSTLSYTGDGTSGIYIWGAQLEAGAFPTSYIPTTTATVTRAADVASITGSNFSSWYNQTEGTVFAEFRDSPSTQSEYPFAISDNTINNRISLLASTSSILCRVVSGGSAFNPGNVAFTNAALTKACIAAKIGSDQAIGCTNGVLSTTGSPASMPVVDRLYVGANHIGTEPINGTIKRLTYWPTRLSNEVLQRITQP